MHDSFHHRIASGGIPEPPGFDIEGVDPLSREVFSALRSSMLLHKRFMMKMLAGQDSHPAQALCLGVLAQRNGMSQSEIADLMHVTRPTVTAMLQRLEAAGVIERRDDEADQRVTRVFLTSEGERVAAAARETHKRAIELSVGWMDTADRKELARLLGAMNQHILSELDSDPEGEVRP